jgi:hypothetical protein
MTSNKKQPYRLYKLNVQQQIGDRTPLLLINEFSQIQPY